MLYLVERGAPSNPAVVFVHGGGLGSRSWEPVIERLPDFFCLAPDLPGQGRSSDLTFTLEGSARAIGEIVEARVPSGRAHVVGLSLGGAVVLTLLRVAPQVVDHAIISGSSGRVPGWLVEVSRPLLAMARLMKPAWMVELTIRQLGIPREYHGLVRNDLLVGSRPAFLQSLFHELTILEPPRSIDRFSWSSAARSLEANGSTDGSRSGRCGNILPR